MLPHRRVSDRYFHEPVPPNDGVFASDGVSTNRTALIARGFHDPALSGDFSSSDIETFSGTLSLTNQHSSFPVETFSGALSLTNEKRICALNNMERSFLDDNGNVVRATPRKHPSFCQVSLC